MLAITETYLLLLNVGEHKASDTVGEQTGSRAAQLRVLNWNLTNDV